MACCVMWWLSVCVSLGCVGVLRINLKPLRKIHLHSQSESESVQEQKTSGHQNS
jgi:hypothetical protein